MGGRACRDHLFNGEGGPAGTISLMRREDLQGPSLLCTLTATTVKYYDSSARSLNCSFAVQGIEPTTNCVGQQERNCGGREVGNVVCTCGSLGHTGEIYFLHLLLVGLLVCVLVCLFPSIFVLLFACFVAEKPAEYTSET